MVFRSRNDDKGPKTVEIHLRSGMAYWVNGVPSKKLDKMLGAAKWGTATTLEFPTKEGGRLFVAYGAVDMIFVRDSPVDGGEGVYHYSEEDDDED